ncbi:MAG: GNAT family N-acetyltransferase [Lachnospiraceae bacterium]
MNIELVRLSYEYKELLFDMLTEWKADIEKNHTNSSPWMIFRNDFHDFDYYLENLEIKEGDESGWIPDTTLFCLDKDRNIFVGAVNIRHYLNEDLMRNGGHIGDGIRPSERRKGYATAMIALALEECKKLGINRVLMCCDKENIGSAKSIIRNGGVLENEIADDNHIAQRYWIQL